MNVDTKTSLRLSRIINASRDRVFQAWTEPELIKQWSAPEGIDVAESVCDLTVGGGYRIVMNTAEGKVHTAYGTYKEVDPPSRLVYTWDWEEEEAQMGETKITVEFNEMGDATEVVILHELFPNEEVREGHDTGWKSCLNQLEAMFA